jgi:predicted MFS family arabinose efflux permease
LVFLGFGEIVGAQLTGFIIDWMGSMKTTLLNILIIALTGFITVFNIYNLEMSVWTYVMTFAWGFSDGAINCHIN